LLGNICGYDTISPQRRPVASVVGPHRLRSGPNRPLVA